MVLEKPEFTEPWETELTGPLVTPGTYSVQLLRFSTGSVEPLSEPQDFFVKPIPAVAAQPDLAETAAFNEQVWQLHHGAAHAKKRLQELETRCKQQAAELARSRNATDDVFATNAATNARLKELSRALAGDEVRTRLSEAQVPSVLATSQRLAYHLWFTTQGPTATQRTALETASTSLATIVNETRIHRRRSG